MTVPGDGLFEPLSPRSGKLRCTVCGTTGWPTGGKYWQAKCLAGHPYPCPVCERRFPCRQGLGTHLRVHGEKLVPAPKLSEQQTKLLAEIRESSTGGLWIEDYSNFDRTAGALLRRGLVRAKSHGMRQTFFVPLEES